MDQVVRLRLTLYCVRQTLNDFRCCGSFSCYFEKISVVVLLGCRWKSWFLYRDVFIGVGFENGLF